MNWRYVNASEVGTSHTATGRPCEDSCWCEVDTTAGGVQVLSMFVADGAGSAARGGQGAEEAIHAAAMFMAGQLAQPEFGLSDELAVDLVMAVRDRLYELAEREALAVRDFACTFIGVVSSELGTMVLQIGDGGVVLDVGQGLVVPVVPMTGEYANMTHFITDADAVTVLVSKVFQGPALRVAAFSDGLQRLALNMADNTAHEPFFAPFFKVLATSTEAQEAELQSALVRFLASERVNERTDDDKTLALAVLTG